MTYNEQTRELLPAEGMWLTQAKLENEKQRTFSAFAYLARKENMVDFAEWSEDQKEQWEREYKPEPEMKE